MTIEQLFIIGNYFDLACGLKSKYTEKYLSEFLRLNRILSFFETLNTILSLQKNS